MRGPKWIELMKQHCEQQEANETTTSQSDTGRQIEVEVETPADGYGSSRGGGLGRQWLGGSGRVFDDCQDGSGMRLLLTVRLKEGSRPRV